MLSNSKYIFDTVNFIKIERNRVYNDLSEMEGLNVYKSDANFIFFESFQMYSNIVQGNKTGNTSKDVWKPW